MGICELHADLLNNILVRLPVECVGQLKCVSKSFNTLISSHKFIENHLNHALLDVQLNKSNILVPGKSKIAFLEISINDNGDFEDSNSKQIHSLAELQDNRDIKKVVGSCNGLVCLLLSSARFGDPCEICCSSKENFCFHDDVFALGNPLTKSSWDLPGNQWKKLFRSNKSLYGFWYDDVNDDYKVVVMNRSSEGILEYECEVYSLRSNSWSQVRCSFCDDLSYCRESVDGFLFNCALHWLFYTYDFGDYGWIPEFILALDVRTYEPKILPLPEEISCGVWELAMLNNCLALTSPTDVLWVMEDYGVSNSWMSMTIRKNESRFWFSSFTPLAFIHKRLLVSYESFGNDVVLHDTVTRHVERIEIDFKQPSGFDGRLKLKQLHFVGSLVQPYPPLVAFEKIMISEEEDGLENFDKFHIHVKGGVSIDSDLPEHVRRKYYELCCSKRSYLHKGWVPAVNSRVAARMITKVVEIADSIRSCTFPTQKVTFETWNKSLRSFELLGMNVGFLRDRISSLLDLSFDNEDATHADKYLYVKSAKALLKYNIAYYENIPCYEQWAVDSKIQCQKYGAEIDATKPKAESYLAIFQQEVNAPW